MSVQRVYLNFLVCAWYIKAAGEIFLLLLFKCGMNDKNTFGQILNKSLIPALLISDEELYMGLYTSFTYSDEELYYYIILHQQ